MISPQWRFAVSRKWKDFSVSSDRAELDGAAHHDNKNDHIFNHIITIILDSWYFIVVNHWFDVQDLFNTDYVIMDNMVQVQI